MYTLATNNLEMSAAICFVETQTLYQRVRLVEQIWALIVSP